MYSNYVMKNSEVTILKVLQSIRANADNVLRSVGLDGVLPVNPEEIANKLDVKIWSLTPKELQEIISNKEIFKGIGLKHEGKYWIVISQDWPKNVKRFAIARELGHIILHSDKLPCLNISDSINSEANKFAEELLIPTKEIVNRASLPLKLISNTFQVSPQAIQIRLQNIFIK